MDVIAPGDPTLKKPAAILIEPLVSNAIGYATCPPLSVVQIIVSGGETAYEWADVSNGVTANMVMKQYNGAARIVWKESGTGTKWAVVMLVVQPSAGAC